MIWASRIIAAFTVIVGPALLLFGRSDLGPWTSRPEEILLSIPFGFQAFAAFGYVVATGVTRADTSIPRTIIAALGCLIIPFVTLEMSLGLLFAVGEFGSDVVAYMAFGVLALPTAAFQVLSTGRGAAIGSLEVLAHLCAAVGSLLISRVLSLKLGDYVAGRILGDWPILLALAPFVALAMMGAAVVPLRRLAAR